MPKGEPLQRFEVFIDEHDVCVVRGELDGATSRSVEARLDEHPDVTTLDLGEVSFLDSAGLRCLLVARQRCVERGTTLVLRRSSTAVRRLFRLAGVSSLFAQDAVHTGPDRRPSRTTP